MSIDEARRLAKSLFGWIVADGFDTPEARDLVRAFWKARANYSWSLTRSVTGTSSAAGCMKAVVDRMVEIGMFGEGKGRRMPTLDEFDFATGRWDDRK